MTPSQHHSDDSTFCERMEVKLNFGQAIAVPFTFVFAVLFDFCQSFDNEWWTEDALSTPER